jgi:hypothetical protein
LEGGRGKEGGVKRNCEENVSGGTRKNGENIDENVGFY